MRERHRRRCGIHRSHGRTKFFQICQIRAYYSRFERLRQGLQKRHIAYARGERGVGERRSIRRTGRETAHFRQECLWRPDVFFFCPSSPHLSRVEFSGAMRGLRHSRAFCPSSPQPPSPTRGEGGSLGVLMPETGDGTQGLPQKPTPVSTPLPPLPHAGEGEFGRPDARRRRAHLRWRLSHSWSRVHDSGPRRRASPRGAEGV